MKSDNLSEDDYYQHDERLGLARLGISLPGSPADIHLQLHLAEEQYWEPETLFPLQRLPVKERPGSKSYVHAKPYILVPDYRLIVALYPQPDLSGAIGQVAGSELHDWKRQEIGQAQAWYYPRDRAIILWECFLEQLYRSGEEPAEDEAHLIAWRGFEQWLVKRFPEATQIYTTWEDIYPRPRWQRFLEAEGYRQVDDAVYPAAFAKPVPHSPREEDAA